MAGRPVSLTWAPPPSLVAAAALLAALMVGTLTAASVPLGVGMLMTLCYLPLVLINLPAAIAVWVAIVFIEHLSVLSVGPTAAGLAIALGWFGTLGTRRQEIGAVVGAHRSLFGTCALLVVWFALSTFWATDRGLVGEEVWYWAIVGLILMVIATTIATPRQLRFVVGAFIAGATLSVLIGVAESGLVSSGNAVETATSAEGRLLGGQGDPNYLAAGLVPAIVLAAAMIGQLRDPIVRISLLVMMAFLSYGLAATQSRGGLVAAVVAAVVAVVLAPRRLVALAAIGLVLLGALLWFVNVPGSWERISDFDKGGTGRSELWTVGWRMFEDHPVSGVGLNNYRAESESYVRQPGRLEFVHLISERPDVTHNTYLQLLAETGLVGLALFLALVGACLRTAWLAVHSFERRGDPRLASLARSVIVAAAGLLAASFFLSNGADTRLWVLLALGPAMLAMARRPSLDERPENSPAAGLLTATGRVP